MESPMFCMVSNGCEQKLKSKYCHEKVSLPTNRQERVTEPTNFVLLKFSKVNQFTYQKK